ncbi:MAG: ribonuclease HI [Candidatus Cloacimonetes bacterium 4572_55]|nr:MAG: ribonuclease HI [Candidatus Cloacimonetes bacterium 4572_55]
MITPEQAEKWRATILSEDSPEDSSKTPDKAKSGDYTLYTDGACRGNPGPGGWGMVLYDHVSNEKNEFSGGHPNTTNNQMEMTAVIEGLKRIGPGSQVTVHSDSQYVIKGITQWVMNWIRRDWRTTSNTPVKNKALWQEIYALSQERKVAWRWVKAHNNNPDNERCDALAVKASNKFSRL